MEGGTQTANKDRDQLLVLKVMRLTRPSFFPTIPVITESRDLAGHFKQLSFLLLLVFFLMLKFQLLWLFSLGSGPERGQRFVEW